MLTFDIPNIDPNVPEPEPKKKGWSLSEWRRSVFGDLYADVSTHTYEIECDEQRRAVDAVRDYGKRIADRRQAGQNVLFIGDMGTGKDHLMVCLATAAVRAGYTLTHLNGALWFEECRERTLSGLHPFRRSLDRADFVTLSDPQPAGGGTVSDAQARWLYELIDARSRLVLPILCTINAVDFADVCRRIGAAAADRLRHQALVILCNWPGRRRAETVVNARA